MILSFLSDGSAFTREQQILGIALESNNVSLEQDFLLAGGTIYLGFAIKAACSNLATRPVK